MRAQLSTPCRDLRPLISPPDIHTSFDTIGRIQQTRALRLLASLPGKRYLTVVALAVLGFLAAQWLIPEEKEAVATHLLGFPNSNVASHQLRPYLLGILCFLPSLGALAYALAGPLDRYLARQFLGAFAVCSAGLILIWVILDLNDNLEAFTAADDAFFFTIRYYGVTFPPVFVLLAPFALLLGLLYCLGKLSHSREIVAMIQTGRGIVRTVAPLAAVGVFLSLASFLLNYHWAPWGDGYRDALVEESVKGSASRAQSFLYFHEGGRRLWWVGSFPYNHHAGTPLRDVEVTTMDEEGRLLNQLSAPIAHWDADTRDWRFHNAEITTIANATGMPTIAKQPGPYTIQGWNETPWQIVRPGLSPQYLGIPELRSWIDENRETAWEERRPFLTLHHYRWAQPWMCLVVVLLATPLGIVFTRRGMAGGVSVALILCAFMLLSAEIFLSLGSAGYLGPAAAAWGTNIVFVAIAAVLIYQRLRGRPIYQTIKNLLPAN